MMEEPVFLKENIVKSKQNDKSGKNAIRLIKVEKQNEFLIEKNLSAFVELIDFLKDRDDVFAVTGYTLCGKSLLASVIPQIITEKTIFYPFKCTACSTLDDLLLGFFETLKVYTQKKLVRLPKIDTQNFQERVNIYLTKCENPVIILLDGLNEITDKKNKDEIMDFLSHTVNLEKIKLVITTRMFEVSDLKNIDLRLVTTLIKPLTLDDLKKYCLKYVINSEGIEDFYKLSRGHYFNLSLSMGYIQPTNLSIKEFVAEVEAQKKSIDELVISKNLSLIPQSYDNLLWVTAMSDFGMPISNLLEVPETTNEQILFLLKKGIIELFENRVFVKDFYKKEILKSVEPLAKINIIKSIIKFLEVQLPLKPSLRELKLSRLTIRNEIERLNNLLNKAQEKKPDKSKSDYMTILGYSRQFKTNWDGFDEIIMPKKDKFPDVAKSQKEEDIKELKVEEVLSEKEVEPKQSENSAFDFAKKLKEKYLYSDALIQYSDAISISMSRNDYMQSIEILSDIAECYFRLGDYSNAIENYGKAHDIAQKKLYKEEADKIMLKIADIYKSLYKNYLAEEIYENLLSDNQTEYDIKLIAELNMFEMNFSNMTPKEIFEKYYSLLDKAQNNSEISAKIHFRIGFLYDKASSFDNAIKHYKKSISLCGDLSKNENLSSCYYNLAEIYSYNKDYQNALDMYLKSYAVDEITKNSEGMLITVRKIAKIYERQKDDKALTYYEKAVDIAKGMNDNYPAACSIIDLGDYYYRKREDMKALRIYMNASKVMANQLTAENEEAIKDRINDLKVRLGKDVVDEVIKEFS